MTGTIRISRASISIVVLFGGLALAAGCGDNAGSPDGGAGRGGGSAGRGGSGGSAGSGGATAGTGGSIVGNGGTGGTGGGAAGTGGAAGRGGSGGTGGSAAGTGGTAGRGGGGGTGGSAAGTGGSAAGTGGSTAGTGGGGTGGSAAGTGGGGTGGSTAGTGGGGTAGTGTGGTGGAGGQPTAVTNLVGSIADRRLVTFRLTWTAPNVNGGAVTGYQVRYGKVPIDSTNFDDAAVATPYQYTRTPAAPGGIDGIDVTPLYVETDYYFAVAGTGGGGIRGPIAFTTAALRSPLMTTVLSGAATDTLGSDADGSGDFGRPAGLAFTADNLSDLLVGASGGTHAYLFFGSATGYSTTPSVTFTGTVAGFGNSIVNAGDIDGDGLADIAIASRSEGKVFIYSRKNPPASWGTTTSWPANLTDAQANYVISSDTTLAGGMYVNILARLGNFDGTGSDDLLVAYPLLSSNTGSVFIVKGSTAFASLTLPSATGAIRIDGAVAGGAFGVTNCGIGQFFPAPAGPALYSHSRIGSAVYAFAGQNPTGTITSDAANDSVVAPAADRYGATIGFLGPLGASPGALALASVSLSYVDVHLGTAATGPFLGAAGSAPAPSVRFTDSAAGNSFGVINIGGGIKGTSGVRSLIGGDGIPDLVLAGQAEAGQPIYIIDGAVLGTLSGSVNVSAPTAAAADKIVKTANKFPSGFTAYAVGTLIPDSNGDGYADFAVGEFLSSGAGRVLVLY